MELNGKMKIGGSGASRPVATVSNGSAGREDLARFSLDPEAAESKQALAWVNSICLAYVIIGLIGFKAPDIVVHQKPPTEEEAVPTVIEPLVTAVQQISPDSSPEQMTEKPEDNAQIVAVTLDSPAIAFSVPTVGNVLVPTGMAQAPPANPMQGAVPVSTTHIETINVTGLGGSRPAPLYPYESQLAKEQGTVLLTIEVNELGRVASVTVKESSGFPRLDKSCAEHVKRRWFFHPAKGLRIYECPIVFQLQ